MKKSIVVLVVLGIWALMAVVNPVSNQVMAASNGVSAMPDEEFFGAYNGTTWTNAGYLDYNLASLATVKTKVMAKDYEGAKIALLAHFKARQDYPKIFDEERKQKDCEVYLDNILTLGNERYIGSFFVEFDWGLKELNITEDVQAVDINDGTLTFIILARNKNEGDGKIKSRESGEGPVLEITLQNGQVQNLTASKDTYINGVLKYTKYGSNTTLYVKDVGDPYYMNARKAYISFDTSSIDSSNIEKIVLKINGRHNVNGTKELIVYKTNEDSWDEANLNYYSHKGKTFNYNQPGGTNWRFPDAAQGADDEYKWQMPRFYYARYLATEYNITKDERFAKGAIDQMLDFIKDKDGAGIGMASFPRNLDAGNRNDSWNFAYPKLVKSNSITPESNVDILKSILKVAKFLNGDYGGDYYSGGNWGIFQTESLYRAALQFPEFKGSQDWLGEVKKRFIEKSTSVIGFDGAYMESTTSYATSVANAFINYIDFYQNVGEPVDQAIRDGATKLSIYMADVLYPNGESVIWGDSGEYPGFDMVKNYGRVLSNDWLKYIGSEGAEGTKPTRTSVEYTSNNISMLRTGWNKNDSYVFFQASYVNSHAHADDNAVLFYSQGNPLIVDTGTFTYGKDPASVWLQKTTAAHNTVEVDGGAQPKGSTQRLAFDTNPKTDYVAYKAKGSNSVAHTRSVFFIKPNKVLVNDYMEPSDGNNHTYRVNWHMPPEIQPSITQSGRVISGTPVDSSQTGVKVMMANNGFNTSIEQGYYSKQFYTVRTNTYSRFTKTQSGKSAFSTLLFPVASGENKAVTYDEIATDLGSLATATKLTEDGKVGVFFQRNDNTLDERTVDTYKINAKVGYVEKTGADLSQFFMKNGMKLVGDGVTILDSPSRFNDIQVNYETSKMDIYSSELENVTDKNAAVKIYAPSGITQVYLNGEEVEFTREGDYIYAVGKLVTATMDKKVIADTYVRGGGYQNETYGQVDQLTLKKGNDAYTRHPYFKYDLTGVDVNSLKKVELKFYVFGSEGNTFTSTVYETDPTGINEDTINWTNQPPRGKKLGTVQIAQASKWYTVDITDVIKNKMTLGEIGIVIIAGNTGNQWAAINSKESANPSYLRLTYVPKSSTTLSVTKDTFVRDGGSANDNYGTLDHMVVKKDGIGYSRKAYVKFDTSSLTKAVKNAKLSFYVKAKGIHNTSVNIYRAVENDFNETAITWNTGLTKGDLVASAAINAVKWYEVDITEYMNNSVNDDNMVFIIETTTSTREDWIQLSTREAGTTGAKITIIE